MQTTWEVEQKYSIERPDQLLNVLQQLGARFRNLEEHVDTYLAHPARDFRQSDEALRVRRMNSQACVTYKGPRQPGPVKSRQEIELKIDVAEWEQWLQLLRNLGFRELPAIRKQRSNYGLILGDREFTVAIDEVDQLGCFAEVELIVSNVADLPTAREAVQALSERLGLYRLEPRSYLAQMLIKLGIENPGS